MLFYSKVVHKVKLLLTCTEFTMLMQNQLQAGSFVGRNAGFPHDLQFLCPQRNFGRHLVIALSVRPSARPSVRPSRFRVRSISPIFFEVGIPNLVCGYILGWRSVAYHFRVTVTLTSDLVLRIIVSGAYLLYYLR